MTQTRLTVADYADVTWVGFPTNHDTIADGVDGHQGTIIRRGKRTLTVAVDGNEYVVAPDDVYPLED